MFFREKQIAGAGRLHSSSKMLPQIVWLPFLDNVLENDKEEQEGKMNSLKILFLDDFSDDELLKEIHECKSRYSEAKIIIFDSQSEDVEKIFDHTAIT